MKIFKKLFRAAQGLNVNYDLYGKHKVDFQAKDRERQQRELERQWEKAKAFHK